MSDAAVKNEHIYRSIASFLSDYKCALPEQGEVDVSHILSSLHERGLACVMLFFALPMALPVPVPPVLNVALALPLLFLTVQQMIGRQDLWLPRKLLERRFKSASIKSLLGRIIPPLQKIELLLKPRLSVLTDYHTQKLIGAMGFVMALCVTIPLPLTNTVPSLGIAAMAIGVLSRDGFAVLIGAIIGLCWVALLLVAFIIFGEQAADIIKATIKSFV